MSERSGQLAKCLLLPKRKAGIESNTFPIRQHDCPPSSPIVAIEEALCDVEQRFDALEQLAVGYLTMVVALEHLDRVEPRTIGWRAQLDKAPGCTAQYGFVRWCRFLDRMLSSFRAQE